MALIWVGEEALMESTQAVSLGEPLLDSMLWSSFFEMEMKLPPGGGGGAVDTAIVMAMSIPDLLSETTTLCFIFSRLLRSNSLQKSTKTHN